MKLYLQAAGLTDTETAKQMRPFVREADLVGQVSPQNWARIKNCLEHSFSRQADVQEKEMFASPEALESWSVDGNRKAVHVKYEENRSSLFELVCSGQSVA